MSDVTVSPKKSLLTPGKLGLSFNVTQWRLYIKDKITRDTKSPISNCLCLRQLSCLLKVNIYIIINVLWLQLLEFVLLILCYNMDACSWYDQNANIAGKGKRRLAAIADIRQYYSFLVNGVSPSDSFL